MARKPSPRRALFFGSAVIVLIASAFGLNALHRQGLHSQADAELLLAARELGHPQMTVSGRTYRPDALIADALRRGADPNVRYGTDPSPVAAGFRWVARHLPNALGPVDTSCEASQHWSVLAMAVSHGDLKAVDLLRRAGAPLTNQIRGEQTLLMLAVDSRSPEMVRLLLQAGMDPNEEDKNGIFPLVFANNSPVITRLLLAHGANPRQPFCGVPLVVYTRQWLSERETKIASPARRAALEESQAMMEAASSQTVASRL